MSILQPEVKTKTASDVANEIRQDNARLYQFILSSLQRGFRKTWNNTELSAQEIFDAFGTEAKDLFILSSDLQTLLAKANPNFVPMIPPHAYTINQDGTVTVNETA